mmetsp:Transcript_39177/g.28945  ORF Transcript_39177/g.28945 Transcript_39177/m.28945 type:complete len:80 (-) Transcript_39177:34-273(-)
MKVRFSPYAIVQDVGEMAMPMEQKSSLVANANGLQVFSTMMQVTLIIMKHGSGKLQKYLRPLTRPSRNRNKPSLSRGLR